MAEKLSVELDVNATEAQKALAKFGGTLEEVHGEGVQPLNFAIGELEDRLYEMAAAGKAGTKEFEEMATEVGRMKKVIIDVDMQVDGLSTSFANKLGGSLQGVASGFELVQGVMGAMGANSEKVEAALLKVQSAMAMAQGIQGIREAIPAFKAFGNTAMTALKGIKGAVMATGIGLLVVAVGTLVSYWDDIKSAISGVSEQQERLNRVAQRNLEIANEQLNNFSKEEEILRLKGVSEKEILKLKIAQTDEAIKAAEIAIKQSEQTLKAQIQAEKKNKEILKGLIKFITAPIQLLLKSIDDVAEFVGQDSNLQDTFNDWTASLIFDPKQVEDEGMKAIKEQKEALEQMKHDRQVAQLQIVNIDKEAAKERLKVAKEKNKELLEKEKRLWEEQKKQSEDLLSAGKALTDAAKERELESIEAIKRAEEGKYNYLQWLRAEDAKRKEEAEQRERERIERNKQFAIDNAEATFTFISDLTTLFEGKSEASQRRAFKIRKAASIAQTLVETYKAAQGAYASQIVPGDPSSPIRGAIAATFATASGLAKVKAISSQKFEGGSASSAGGSSASPSLPTSSPANFTIVGNSGTNQLAETLTNAPIQAYVVGGEVTTQQQLDRSKINVATW